MAYVTINEEYLTNIASAIRLKNGSGNTYRPKDMPAAIAAIEGGVSLTADRIICVDNVEDYMRNGILTVPSDILAVSGETSQVLIGMKNKGISRIVIEPSSYPLTIIGFHNCEELTSIEITGRCVIFQRNSFSNCTNLSEVVAERAYDTDEMHHIICSNAFRGCYALTKLELYGQTAYSATSDSYSNSTGLYNYTVEPFGLRDTGIQLYPPRYIPPYGLAGCTGEILPILGESTIDKYALASSTYKTVEFVNMDYSTDYLIHPNAFSNSSVEEINVPWAEGDVPGAPWGAPEGVVINYNVILEV